jgi:aspartate aminotransferase-like enzyme
VGTLRDILLESGYERLLMTPGPTMVDERVRAALAQPATNPDLDPDFATMYRDLCDRLAKIIGTRDDVLILSGEGLLGLEAAVCSVVEPGMKVLCVANGHFGEGFGRFVEIYGGHPVYLRGAYDHAIGAEDVEAVLKEHPDVRVATIVHCETPSGLLNPVAEIVEPLKARGIISIVDAVSSLGGEPFHADDWGVDIVLGGSQKVLSAPPGLAFLSVSSQAWEMITNRKTPIASYYCSLLPWRDMWVKSGVFPYTPSISDIYALDEAVSLLLEEGLEQSYARHFRMAEATRATLRAAGMDIYPQPGAEANTVTAFRIPAGVDDALFRKRLWDDEGVMIAGSWGALAGKIWRIGHMGANCRPEHLMRFFMSFERMAKEFSIPLATSVSQAFASFL